MQELVFVLTVGKDVRDNNYTRAAKLMDHAHQILFYVYIYSHVGLSSLTKTLFLIFNYPNKPMYCNSLLVDSALFYNESRQNTEVPKVMCCVAATEMFLSCETCGIYKIFLWLEFMSLSWGRYHIFLIKCWARINARLK